MLKRSAAANHVKCKTVSALEKILLEKEPTTEESFGTVLKNEWAHYQIAVYCDLWERGIYGLQVLTEGALKEYTEVAIAENVPCNDVSPDADEYYLKKGPCLLPDPLKKFGAFGGIGMSVPYKQWKGIWVRVKIGEDVPAGVYETKFTIVDREGNYLCECLYTLEVIDAVLPKTDLKLTNWIHYDCIAEKHGAELFSDAFYRVFESYLTLYVEGGYNMLLTPIFTPPLDTEIGYERKTAQLVKIKKEGGRYAFDFSDLKRFVDFAFAHGIEYIEFSHLFTQWGGKHCPKIVAEEDGEEKRIFGWDVDSDSAEYTEFLGEFFLALGKFIDDEKIREKCFVHLTDEPHGEQIEMYGKCRETVKKCVGDMPVMDALGEYAFYERGLVDLPVVAIESYKNFEEHGVKNVLVYNCCFPVTGHYSNRFIDMPSERTRVLGYQLYASGVLGYLHWGYNFYNTARSLDVIDPYADTSAGGAFPPGDGFIVYPAKDGAIPSVRWAMAQAGFQDYRAMKLLERYIGREKALNMLKEWGMDGYTVYSRDPKAHTDFRNKINFTIKEFVNRQ